MILSIGKVYEPRAIICFHFCIANIKRHHDRIENKSLWKRIRVKSCERLKWSVCNNNTMIAKGASIKDVRKNFRFLIPYPPHVVFKWVARLNRVWPINESIVFSVDKTLKIGNILIYKISYIVNSFQRRYYFSIWLFDSRRGLNRPPPVPHYQIQFVRREEEGEGEGQCSQWQHSLLRSCKYKLPGKNYLILKLRESTDHVYNIELANMC